MRKKGRFLGRTLSVTIVLLMLLSACAGVQSVDSSDYTKAEFTAMISDYFGWPHPTEYNDIWKVPLKPINDVSTGDMYGKQIETAYEEGVIDLDSSGKFNPEALITGDEAAAIILKAYELSGANQKLVSDLAGKETISRKLADSVFENITSTIVAPVQAVPKTNAVAPRRYVKLWCPTPGTTIFFTNDGTEPTTDSEIYTVAVQGHINEILSNDQLPEKDVVYKTVAIKTGMESSPAQTYSWHLYRPLEDDFQADLIVEATATSPAVYRLYNDSESVRAMAWYIEGSERGVLFDALQTKPNVKNIKEYIDNNIATKPNFLIVGHSHGDHSAQMQSFIDAGVDVYINERGFDSIGNGGYFPAMVPDPVDQAKVMNVDEGDVFSLGNCELRVFAHPGHANDNIILQDKENGMIFSSDIYGCTRAGSADNVGISGVKVDTLLSITQQITSGYKKDGGKIDMLFTGHDESPLNGHNIELFEAALQQVIDLGEAGCTPTLRGRNNKPGTRTTLIGDMWKDGTNWIALGIGGKIGDDYDYLSSTPINYNGNGFKKYSVLSNIEIEGGELIGTDLSWKTTPGDFQWAGETIKAAPNSIPNKFDPWTYEYTINVPKGNDAITIIPTSMSTKVSMMLLDGLMVDYRSHNKVSVSDGTEITIEIVAPDTITKSTYTFTVSKK